jgi:hypothetical protein
MLAKQPRAASLARHAPARRVLERPAVPRAKRIHTRLVVVAAGGQVRGFGQIEGKKRRRSSPAQQTRCMRGAML